MCVKIIKNNIILEYDLDKDFAEQMQGSTQVVVNYRPQDEEIEHFLHEMQMCAATGMDPKLNIKIHYNDFLDGYKTKKKLKKALNDIDVNELVKLMVLSQVSADNKLEELSAMCLNREADAK
jgi:hypothetical protein